MPGRAKHIGQDPKYLEKFIDDGDTLEDFEVEPDVFYGVRPPAPISSRVSYLCSRTHIQVLWLRGARGRAFAPMRVGPIG